MDRKQKPRRIDEPEPCFVRLRVNKGSWQAARIYRALGMLCGEINGASVDPLQIWHSGDQITESEYHALILVTNSPKPF